MNRMDSNEGMNSIRAIRGSASLVQKDEAADLMSAANREQRGKNVLTYEQRASIGLPLFDADDILS